MPNSLSLKHQKKKTNRKHFAWNTSLCNPYNLNWLKKHMAFIQGNFPPKLDVEFLPSTSESTNLFVEGGFFNQNTSVFHLKRE